MLPSSTKTPLAFANLTDDLRRFAVSLAGVTLAVVLMFMQIGFRNALLDSMVETIEQLDADVVIVNRLKPSFNVKHPFPRSRLYEALGFEGVEQAHKLYMESFASRWRNAESGKERKIRVLAFNPDEQVFLLPEIRRHARALRAPDTVMMDERSKPIFGPRSPGLKTELAGRNVRLIGTFRMGTDFWNDGTLVMSDRNFLKFFPDRPVEPELDLVELGLLKVTPGIDVQALVEALSLALPDDVLILPKAEYVATEMRFWQNTTPIGFIFGLGAVMGFVVGIVICYQVLHADVTDRLAEFATLKAIGYHNRYLIGVVLKQAFILSILGFVAGYLIGAELYDFLAATTGLLMRLTWRRTLGIFIVTILMCMISGCIAVRQALSADPAELFG